jgi:tetratricopeptide (TPR) repeat protein
MRLYALVAQSADRIDEAIGALERIAVLERDPPEIIGALADMLGQAGRYSEALPLWDRLVARHPELADAHLNRAIAAANAGRHELAVEAAVAGLKRFPGHARLLATRAMALKNAGRIEDAVKAFEVAVAADPDRALTRHNQAVALRAACRYDEACEAYQASARLGMKGEQFLANWAAAALEAERIDEAAELYGKALADNPGHQESLRGLTRLQIEYRGGEEAFKHYEMSVSRRRSPEAWSDWLAGLCSHNRHAEAAEIGIRALVAFPEHSGLTALSAFASGITGDAVGALDEFERLPAGMQAERSIMIARAQLALRAHRFGLAAELAEEAAAMDPGDQIAWSLLGVAWRMLDDDREHWLCDYERLVMVTDVTPPGDSMEAGDYARIVAAALDPLHLTTAAPGDQTLRGGTQTSGALFARPEPEIQRFREAVLIAAAKAVAELPDDPTHPFLRRKTTRFGFSGSWSVRLKGGGYHVPHFHAEGWMSSAYYARLPQIGADGHERHEGWIQFGQPPEMFDLDLPPRRIVEPQPGRLVLFPSYLWHGTIPFEGEDRLTAAFDYIPA